jgi:hypothetical protein
MEPQYMIMGQSAGVAASMAAKTGRPVQKIDIFELQERLKVQRQILSLKENPYGLWSNEKEIIIDNNMKGFVSFTGDWSEEETVPTGRYEMNFRVKQPGRIGTFEYIPYFFNSGNYRVYCWYPASTEFNSQVAVQIHHAGGRQTVMLNQQEGGGAWHEIGAFRFEQGRRLAVVIEAQENQRVVADAFKFQLVQ